MCSGTSSPIISPECPACLHYLPPSVAESRKWVPYFLIMLSVMAPRLGLLPSCLMVCRNSGSSGKEKPLFSCLSRAKLFTFQRPNSLKCTTHTHTDKESKASITHDCSMPGRFKTAASMWTGWLKTLQGEAFSHFHRNESNPGAALRPFH